MKIFCIFDARGSFLGEISHFFKKYVFGQSCAMCDISHNLTGEKQEWRDMSETLEYDIKLLHIDEMDSMLEKFVSNSTPCVVASMKSGFKLLANREELSACAGNINSFRKLLEQKIVQIKED
jgi:hypothetical protein